MKINVNTKLLKAAFTAAAKTDYRYYLRGVLFDIQGKHLHIVATDGHRMNIARIELGEETKRATTHVMDMEIIKQIVALPIAEVEIEFMSRGRAKVTHKTLTIISQGVECKYPDWRKVMPERDQLRLDDMHVNPQYIAACNTTAKLLATTRGAENNGITLYSFGGEKLAVQYWNNPNFCTIIMAMRANAGHKIPDWFYGTQAEGNAAAGA